MYFRYVKDGMLMKSDGIYNFIMDSDRKCITSQGNRTKRTRIPMELTCFYEIDTYYYVIVFKDGWNNIHEVSICVSKLFRNNKTKEIQNKQLSIRLIELMWKCDLECWIWGKNNHLSSLAKTIELKGDIFPSIRFNNCDLRTKPWCNCSNNSFKVICATKL